MVSDLIYCQAASLFLSLEWDTVEKENCHPLNYQCHYFHTQIHPFWGISNLKQHDFSWWNSMRV